MRVALAIAATIALPIRAVAQSPGETPPTPAPTPPAAAPTADPAAAEAPPPDAAPTPSPPDEPKADPAYGERPEPSYDTRNFPAPRGKDVVIVSYPDRSRANITTLAVLGGSGVLLGAIGAYFNLDARSAIDEVSAHSYTGKVWTAERQDTYDRAHSSSVAAGVLYGIGGGLLLATAIMYIATEPKAETMVIHPHAAQVSPIVAPTGGGAVVGGAWSF